MTLRVGTPEQIQHMFNRMADDAQDILDGLIRMCYFMRGAISFDEMKMLTPGERHRIEKFLDTRLKDEAKKMHPVY